jgi:hypothetical protein
MGSHEWIVAIAIGAALATIASKDYKAAKTSIAKRCRPARSFRATRRNSAVTCATSRRGPPKSNDGVDCIHEKDHPCQGCCQGTLLPDQIEIDYYPVDEFGKWAGPGIYTKGPFTWEEVKLRFGLGETYAAVCEGFFGQGTGAFIQGPKDVERIGSNPVIRAMTSHQFRNLSSPVLPQWRKARPKDDDLPPAWPSHQRQRKHGLHHWL